MIWLAVIAVGVLVMAIRDRSLARNIGDVAKMAARPPISIVIVVFFAYMALWVWVAARLGAWKPSLAKETFIWAVVSGLAVLFSANAAKDPSYFRRAIRHTFAATVVIEFFFGLAALVVELIIQPVMCSWCFSKSWLEVMRTPRRTRATND